MRSDGLLSRIKVALNLVRYGKGKCRMMTCEKCGSIYIAPISKKPYEYSYIKDDVHIDSVWREFSRCLKCGAVCEEVQLWNFSGDPKKINKNITVN